MHAERRNETLGETEKKASKSKKKNTGERVKRKKTALLRLKKGRVRGKKSRAKNNTLELGLKERGGHRGFNGFF